MLASKIADTYKGAKGQVRNIEGRQPLIDTRRDDAGMRIVLVKLRGKDLTIFRAARAIAAGVQAYIANPEPTARAEPVAEPQ